MAPANKGVGDGHVTANGYRRFKRAGKNVLEHRLVWEGAHGAVPDGFVVHHKDGDKLNNALANLELKEWGLHSREHGLVRQSRTGWSHTFETREKMRAAALRRWQRRRAG